MGQRPAITRYGPGVRHHDFGMLAVVRNGFENPPTIDDVEGVSIRPPVDAQHGGDHRGLTGEGAEPSANAAHELGGVVAVLHRPESSSGTARLSG